MTTWIIFYLVGAAVSQARQALAAFTNRRSQTGVGRLWVSVGSLLSTRGRKPYPQAFHARLGVEPGPSVARPPFGPLSPWESIQRRGFSVCRQARTVASWPCFGIRFTADLLGPRKHKEGL